MPASSTVLGIRVLLWPILLLLVLLSLMLPFIARLLTAADSVS
jgi:hypothetical protein